MFTKRTIILLICIFSMLLVILLALSLIQPQTTNNNTKNNSAKTTLTTTPLDMNNVKNQQQVIGTFNYAINYVKSSVLDYITPYKYEQLTFSVINGSTNPVRFSYPYFSITDEKGNSYTPVYVDTTTADNTTFLINGNTVETKQIVYRVPQSDNIFTYTFSNTANTKQTITL